MGLRGDEAGELRPQLLAAKAATTRQLSILHAPSSDVLIGLGGGPPDNRGVIAELKAELAQIDEALGTKAAEGDATPDR